MKTLKLALFNLLFFALFISCQNKESSIPESKEFKVEFEKFTLENGLQVIFHIDNSDPVVAVALTSHVGSAREIEGRTGFAHLFEHLLFLESENLGKGGLDAMSARIGGSGANGSTSRDRTNYFQTVPKDALEKMIWAEADKLGFFINTVTEQVLAKEKQVVKNEKRQGVDNRPYGHKSYVIGKNLYPEGHPYNWQVIGSLEDLQNATLQDVKDFYNRWYVPNNVTLTIAGDFDPIQAKFWVEKYFNEIASGDPIPKIEKQQVVLSTTKNLYYEDNFARLPQLTRTWPTVYQYHADSYALQVLANYLSKGKNAPLYKKLVEEKKLTDGVRMYQYGAEIAGEFILEVVAFENMNLTAVNNAINEAFENFKKEGISQKDLDRIKARQETNFYNSLSSVLGKGFQLAQYEIFTGDPGFINQDVQNILAVTTGDVMEVFQKYIYHKNYIVTSFVPMGMEDLALEGAILAEVVEEQIVEGAEESFDASIVAEYEKTPSSFDRSIEPSYGESPKVKVPNVWKETLSSGIKLFGIENNEVPLVQFQIQIKGGLLLENKEKIGLSNLLAKMITKGTKNKTPEQLENAVESLGASINAYATKESIIIGGNTLSKNYEETMNLVREIVLEPRWDQKEFDLIKQSVLSTIERRKGNPNSIASTEFAKLVYGEGHVLGNNIMGNEASVNAISLEDLKAFYKANMSPSVTNIHIVGAITENTVQNSLVDLNSNWRSREVIIPEISIPNAPEKSKVYFYNIPDAKQSVIKFGYGALAETDKDYYPAEIMNYRLGGGGFASELMQQLREAKGYTYGIYSGFNGTNIKGPFEISSGVRSNVTYESASLVKNILENYGENYDENDLNITKSYLIKSNARAFETNYSKLSVLQDISNYNFPDNYVQLRENIVKDMTVEEVRKLSEKYLDSNKMIYLFVGDAKTQMDKLEQLGFGKPILLNEFDNIKL